jgi:regulator of replication initiation timing
VIRDLANKIKTGIKFFVGHGRDNSNDNRESVGEILSSFVKEINGRLSNIIIGHFPSNEKVRDMDTCSMEADVHTDEDHIVGEINEVTGIALGSSDRDNPAFPGALRLNMIQCFGDETDDDEGDDIMARLTFEQLKQGIRELNVHPWQIFTLDELKNDKVFGKVFEDNSTLKAENERLSKENENVKTQSKEAVRKTDILESSGKLDELMKEGFTDKQRTFIKGRFDPEKMEDLSEENLKTFIEDEKNEFAETAKLFGGSESGDGGSGTKEGDATDDDLEEQALKIMGVKE